MTLLDIQQALVDAIRAVPSLGGADVLAEAPCDIVAERDANFARQRICVVVGPASFACHSNSARTIVGKARLEAVVYEQPSRNRIAQAMGGQTVTGVAEAVADGANLARFDGGVFVCAGIGGVERVDEKTVSRAVVFETIVTLAPTF